MNPLDVIAIPVPARLAGEFVAAVMDRAHRHRAAGRPLPPDLVDLVQIAFAASKSQALPDLDPAQWSQPPTGDTVSRRDAAEQLGLTEQRVSQLVDEGRLENIGDGTRLAITATSLDAEQTRRSTA